MILFSLAGNTEALSSLAFTIENDGIIREDQGYTSGMFLSYNPHATYSLKNSAPLGVKHLASLLPLNDQYLQAWQVSMGQQIWTPVDIEIADEQEDSRPYAGLFFLKTNFFELSPQLTHKYTFMLGRVGPSSYAKKTQRWLHDLIGSPRPLGWENQINNQWVYMLGIERQLLLIRTDVSVDYGYDFSWNARANIGNYKSEVALGATYRWGISLNQSFGSVGFTPGNYLNASLLSSSSTGYFFYSGLEGRYRFNDITIDGDRPDHIYDINIENWQTSIILGITYYRESYGVSFNLAFNSPEYIQDKSNYSGTGTIDFFFRL
jgi:hypothetical protein